jgi:hypothetical protein
MEIGFRAGLFNIDNGLDYTHLVQNIRVDEHNQLVITIEKLGSSVETILIPYHQAKKMGLINFDVLKNIIK